MRGHIEARSKARDSIQFEVIGTSPSGCERRKLWEEKGGSDPIWTVTRPLENAKGTGTGHAQMRRDYFLRVALIYARLGFVALIHASASSRNCFTAATRSSASVLLTEIGAS